MIINTHPRERESKHTLKIINNLEQQYGEPAVHISDKTTSQWQDIIKSDEPMRFVGPVYWWGMGHEFEKWMQEALSYGFAYQYENNVPVGLLHGRSFEMHLVHGTPAVFAEKMRINIKDRITIGVYGLCGADSTVVFYDMHDIV